MRGEVKDDVVAGISRVGDFVELLAELGVIGGVLDVARQVEDPLGEGFPDFLVEFAVFGKFPYRGLHLFAVGLVAHLGAGVANDGKAGGKPSVQRQAVERRKELAFCEVAVGAENDHGRVGYAALETERVHKGVGIDNGFGGGHGNYPSLAVATGSQPLTQDPKILQVHPQR